MSGKPTWEGVARFLGLDTEQHPAAREEGLLQVDEGSCREKKGVWKPRRGMTKANVTKKDNAIAAVIAFELPTGDFVAVVAEGQKVHSEASFDE